MGVPADYYPAVMRAIDLIGQGRSQTRACDEAGITVTTFRHYVKNTPELHQLFDDAEQRGYDSLADVLLEINRMDNHYGVTDPKEQKVLSDNIKWFLARKRPSQYGDRMTIDQRVTVNIDKVIVDALQRGAERAGRVLEDVEYKAIENKPRADVINLDGIPDELLELI